MNFVRLARCFCAQKSKQVLAAESVVVSFGSKHFQISFISCCLFILRLTESAICCFLYSEMGIDWISRFSVPKISSNK